MNYVELAAPFPLADVHFRPGATNREKTQALALAYLDARAIMDRLDEVVGPENWKDEYTSWEGKGMLCRLSLRIDGEWVGKEDAAEATDIEPVKGAVSDALKRAAVKWGIGRYLYNLDNAWVKCEERGRSVILLEKPRLPTWALPKGAQVPPAASQRPTSGLTAEEERDYVEATAPEKSGQSRIHDVQLPEFPTASTWIGAFRNEQVKLGLTHEATAKVIGKQATNNNVIEWVHALVDSDPESFPTPDVAAGELLKRIADSVAVTR